MDRFDAIVIGGGHNGLTAACYLSKAGLKTLVLERRSIVGGACITEEIHPGFRTSTLSYISSLLHPQVIADLELERYGYDLLSLEGTVMVCPDGRELNMTRDPAQQQRAIAQYSNTDFQSMIELGDLVGKAGAAIRGQWLRSPPRLNGKIILDLPSVVQLAKDLYRTPEKARQMLARILTGSARQIIDRWFTSEMMRLYYVSGLTIGNYASMDAPASAISLLRHGLRTVKNSRPTAVVRGGMGAITQAMAAFARDKGCTIRTNSVVEKVLIENGKVAGVRLSDGTEIISNIVLSNADPKRTFFGFVGEQHLPSGFLKDISGIRMDSGALKINLAVRTLPVFKGSSERGVTYRHRSLINLVESWPAIDESYRRSIVGEIVDPGMVQMVIPSALDESLAPAGSHVVSMACKYFPYDLKNGRSWDEVKELTADRVLTWVERFMPGLKDSIIARHVVTPLDLEREYSLPRGDIHHGRLDPDQLWAFRPHPDAAQYRTPIAGLYLCGAGSHPGGGVTAAPGHNAAHKVLRDQGRSTRSGKR